MRDFEPRPGERPAEYAARLGRWHVEHEGSAAKRSLGQYFTPLPVADLMAAGCEVSASNARVLDPGAGSGILACALAESLVQRPRAVERVEITAIEVDQSLADLLRKTMDYLGSWLHRRGAELRAEIRVEDFVLANASSLDDLQPPLRAEADGVSYDVVIANPPYFKLPKSDPRAQAAAAIVHGQPNIYSVFMAVAASLLSDDGELVAITPRSFSSGQYFARFRSWFFERLRPRAVHIFESRRDAFRHADVLQENIILWARADRGWSTSDRDSCRVEISLSAGIADLESRRHRSVPMANVLDPRDHDRSLWLPLSEEDDEARQAVESWPESLGALGLRVSTGPVVPFRARRYLATDGSVPSTHAPLLWMQHVRPMDLCWPIENGRKEQYASLDATERGLLIPDGNYVALRRFSAKEERRRLVAAPILKGQLGSPMLGLENHLNYIHRPGGTLDEDEAFGLAALYNSALLDRYFRILSGNTQVSATELRATPLPPKETILRLGRLARSWSGDLEDLDELVSYELGLLSVS